MAMTAPTYPFVALSCMQVHQKREAKLVAELAEARQLVAAALERGEGLQRELEAALDRAERAEARVAVSGLVATRGDCVERWSHSGLGLLTCPCP